MIVQNSSVPVNKIEADVVALTFFEDERPLRGVAGQADWRMNGALSRLVMNETLCGREGESLLISTDGRLLSPRLLLFGLGDSKFFDGKRFQVLLSIFVGTVAKLKFSRLAITIPGSSLFSTEKAVDSVKKELEKAGMPDDTEVIIIG
ncbi:MAG: cytosol aminopeptidase [Deltaproteobacteria bacterium]|nr:cytosol aminopeptidase [Deltaproteobacteria bacterium]MBM2838294.1 cytosol aminopeptidase [Deltaproteobacteria bacterium]